MSVTGQSIGVRVMSQGTGAAHMAKVTRSVEQSTSRKRVFIDAKDAVRCKADIRLSDGSLAQCGRREAQAGLARCWQHQDPATSELPERPKHCRLPLPPLPEPDPCEWPDCGCAP
jgi:hypothetical protein